MIAIECTMKTIFLPHFSVPWISELIFVKAFGPKNLLLGNDRLLGFSRSKLAVIYGVALKFEWDLQKVKVLRKNVRVIWIRKNKWHPHRRGWCLPYVFADYNLKVKCSLQKLSSESSSVFVVLLISINKLEVRKIGRRQKLNSWAWNDVTPVLYSQAGREYFGI